MMRKRSASLLMACFFLVGCAVSPPAAVQDTSPVQTDEPPRATQGDARSVPSDGKDPLAVQLVTRDALETYQVDYDYNQYNEHAEFSFHPINSAVYNANDEYVPVRSLAATEEYLYIANGETVQVLDHDLNPVRTIRSGPSSAQHFMPAALCPGQNGELYVLTDVHNQTQTMHLLTYDWEHRLVGEELLSFPAYSTAQPIFQGLVMTKDGFCFTAMGVSVAQYGRLYQIENGKGTAIGGEGLFGYLCTSADGEKTVFANGAFALNEQNETGTGVPALYLLDGAEVLARTEIPPVLRFLYDPEELELLKGRVTQDEWDGLLEGGRGIACEGVNGLAQANGLYYVLLDNVLLVYDEELNHMETIKIPAENYWGAVERYETINRGEYPPAPKTSHLAAAPSGDLFFFWRDIRNNPDDYYLVHVKALAG